MHKKVQKLFTVLLSGSLLCAGAVAAAAEYQPGEVIVKFKDGGFRPRVMMNQIYGSVGVKKIRRFSGMMNGYEHLTLDSSVKVEDAIAALLQNDAVEYAQPNFVLRAFPVHKNDGLPGFPGLPGGGEDPGNGDGGGLPGFPGMPGGGDPGNGGGDGTPCIFPGIPFPPGCTDNGGGDGGGIPGFPGNPGQPGQPGQPSQPVSRPDLQPAPAEVNPPVADPQLAKVYGLKNIGAIDAWNIHKGSKNFIVADIDTGIDYNHEDLSFNLWRNPNPGAKNDVVGYDFIHDDGLPFDDNEHGTHTAGTIGAVGGNGIGVSGVTQRVSLMALKFLSGEGQGDTAGAIRAIDYAVEHGAKILSNSWGGPADDGNKALFDAIERAKAKDVLFIAAAGNESADNDGSRASYPAAFDNDNLISVAATDQRDGLAYFSNYGKKTTHVGAPGVGITSTIPGSKYASLDGTSMACPAVAGAAALVWSKNPSLTYKQVKDILLKTVDQVPALQGKTVTGGRINVLKALRSME